MKCPRCGVTVPDMPEDSTYDEQLCNLCFDELAQEDEDGLLGIEGAE